MIYQTIHKLSDLVNLSNWFKMQSSITEVFEVPLRTYLPDGNNLSRRAESSAFNSVLAIHCSKPIEEICRVKKVTRFRCEKDFDLYVIPIRAVGHRVAAYLLLGPTSIEKKKAMTITTLIEDTFSHMAQTGYHKKRLGEIAPKIIEVDPIFSKYYESKVLNSLLNVCTLALDADSGSVMTLDRTTKLLHIKAASKIKDDIIADTNVRLGEGIAGVAAAKDETLILPDDQSKNGLSARLKRSYIKSSMIMPFNKGNSHDVYGVINLNITRKNKRFSNRDKSLVKELVDLASIALIPVKEEISPFSLS